MRLSKNPSLEKASNLEAIVLAGGLGTRLRSILLDVPKPMAPIGEKPFLEYILKYLHHNGIARVILSVGYKWKIIQAYFGNNFMGIELIYSIEDEPLGTGGAIKKALALCKHNNIFVVNGDTFFNVNLQGLKLPENSQIELSLKPMKNFDRYGCVETNHKGFVTTFTEKGFRESGNINGGIYLLSKNIFDKFSLTEKFSFEEFIQTNFKQLNISTKVFDDYFIDIGIPEDYHNAQIDLRSYDE